MKLSKISMALLLFSFSIAYANNQPQFVNVSKHHDYLAPDGSQTRLLAKNSSGSMAEFTLPPKTTSQAIHQREVQELWFFIHGEGQVWVKYHNVSKIYNVHKNSSISLPKDITFQFRNTSNSEPLVFIDVTMPPWPGSQVTAKVKGIWRVSSHAKF